MTRGHLRNRHANGQQAALASLPAMRDHAVVARKQIRTSNYSPEDRVRLGEAVEAARVAAGYKFRPEFCRAHGIRNLRGLELLEQGQTGVGQAFLFEVADALPDWTRDTPRIILEGGEPPPPAAGRDGGEPAVIENPEPRSAPTGRVWTAEMDTKFRLLKDILKSQGLEMTEQNFLTMLDQGRIELRARQNPNPVSADDRG